jgi:nucleotide-binding universal stress UspA family protein
VKSVMTRPPGPQRTTAPGAAGRIVVGIDDSPGGRAALRWAIAQARAAHVPLLAVRSWALGLPGHGGRRRRRSARVRHPHLVLRFDGFEQREASARLVSMSFKVVAGGIPRDVTVTVQTPEGDPGVLLAGAAGTPGDLLVLGRDQGPSVQRLLHGSVASYCCEHAHCPVVIVPADSGRTRDDRAREETP